MTFAVAFVASSLASSASLVFAVLIVALILMLLALHGDGSRVLFVCAFVLVLSWTTYAAVQPSVVVGPCYDSWLWRLFWSC